MWPRMLFELLPHLARLVPVADRFFATRNASDKAQELAFAAMSESLHGDLGQVAETHAGIQRALREQGEQVAAIAVEVTRARMGVESIEARVGKIESRIAKLEERSTLSIMLLAVAIGIGVVAVVLLVIVLLHVLSR